MKTITTTTSVRKADSSLDATLNPVELSSGELVSWGAASTGPSPATTSTRVLAKIADREPDLRLAA